MVPTLEYFPTIKRNEVLIHVTTWMNIMLSEINQIQKDKCCMIPFHELPRVDKFIETESRLELTRDCRERNGELLPMVRTSIRDDEKVLEIDSGNGYTILLV